MPDLVLIASEMTATPSLLTEYISELTDCLLPLTEMPSIAGSQVREEKKPTEFGAWLLPRLRSRQINREQFARLCKVGSSVVAKWIFVSRPSAASCQLVADALHIDVSEVLDAAGYPVGRVASPGGELRSEASQLIELMPDSLLLPYVLGMRAIVANPDQSGLIDQIRNSLEEESQ